MTTNNTNKILKMLELPTRTTTNAGDLFKQTDMYTSVPSSSGIQTTSGRLNSYIADEISSTGSVDHITDTLRYTKVSDMSIMIQDALMDDIRSLIEQNTGELNDFDRVALNKKILNVCMSFLDIFIERFIKLEKEIEQTRLAVLAHSAMNRFTQEQLDSLNEHVLRELRASIIDIKERTK